MKIFITSILMVATPVSIHALQNQTQREGVPKWEVVSIKPCKPGERGGGGGRGGQNGNRPSLDRINTPCMTVAMLVNEAYIGQGRANLQMPVTLEGGPAWINADSYQISAKAEVETTQETMMSSMLQMLLEDRFKLKVRRETREVPVLALMTGKGGLKSKQGNCIPFSPANPPPAWDGKSEPPRLCGTDLNRLKPNGDRSYDLFGASLDQLSSLLSRLLSRTVINKTGINGTFDFHLEYAPERDNYPPGFVRSDDPPGPSLFTAIQEQLGLKLDSVKGPSDFLVIDHIEKPTEN